MFSPDEIPLPSSSTDVERKVFVYRTTYANPYGNVSLNSEQENLTAKEVCDIVYRAIASRKAPVKAFHRNGEEYGPTEIIYENHKLLEDVIIIHLV